MTGSGLWNVARRLLAPLSPRRRRWQRFLAGLDLDPDGLPRPVGQPGAHDFVICGPPRTGTTLLAAALFQPPHVLTVMEPWDGMRLPPADLFASLRAEIEATGRLGRGKLDIEYLFESRGVRWCADGTQSPPLETTPGYQLGVKWPAYWQYLDLLPETRFLVCLRDPVEVVGSFRRKAGRLGQGLEYDIAFNRRLNEHLEAATHDPETRRSLLYETILRRVLPAIGRPNVLAVRYERWFSEPERLLADIAEFLGADLGAPRVDIRPSPHATVLRATEIARVRTICTTAAALGYRGEA